MYIIVYNNPNSQHQSRFYGEKGTYLNLSKKKVKYNYCNTLYLFIQLYHSNLPLTVSYHTLNSYHHAQFISHSSYQMQFVVLAITLTQKHVISSTNCRVDAHALTRQLTMIKKHLLKVENPVNLLLAALIQVE